MKKRLRIISSLALIVMSSPAIAEQIDQLFHYPAILSQSDGGAYRVVDYREMRDVNGRDTIPEKQVKREYVSLSVNRQQKDMKLTTDKGALRSYAVGKQTGASVIVLYLHGQGGNRKQGVNDATFGGNFNRLKNVVVEAGGLYLSPDFSTFGDTGAGEVEAIIEHFSEQSPKAQIIVACGSMGGMLCWKLAQNPDVAAKLGGLVLLGSLWEKSFFDSPAYNRKVPVFFGHGSRDPVFPIDTQTDFFRKILGKSKKYPTQFVRFESGIHGTPIRMVDWRETLDWIMAR